MYVLIKYIDEIKSPNKNRFKRGTKQYILPSAQLKVDGLNIFGKLEGEGV